MNAERKRDLAKVWDVFPVLETERLLLREMVRADTADHFKVWSNAQVMAGHGIPALEAVSQSQETIDWYKNAFKAQEAIRWAITLRGEERLIGTCGYHHMALRHHRAEIGYELHPDYWRRGLASEAVRAVLRHGFRDMGLHRVEAIVDPVNKVSAAFLRHLGFTEEGYLRERFFDNGRFVDDWFFSLLVHEFDSA